MAMIPCEYDDPNIVEVDQTVGNSITLNYNGITGYARAANSPIYFCAFPFFAKNTSYSVTVTSFNIDGTSSGDITNKSVYAKYKNGCTIQATSTMSYKSVFGGSAVITITFA